MAYGP
jgi:long-subunit acyl-CoA synthetase (AMP-forming)